MGDRRIRFVFAEGEDIEQMRDAMLQTELYQLGDCRLVWVNEGDFWSSRPVEMPRLPHPWYIHGSMVREYGPYVAPQGIAG